MSDQETAEIPALMTMPCIVYHGERFNLLMFINLSTQIIPKQLDDFARNMANNIEEEKVDPTLKSQWETHRQHGLGAQQEMLVYETLAAEMFIVRYVSTFFAYLAEILALVFQAKPEMLADSSVTVKEVLEYGAPEALISIAAERKINSISDKGMKSLNEYFERAHKLPLFQNATEIEEAEYIRAVRNLIVHNRGMVNQKFLVDVPERQGKDTRGSKVQLGEVFDKLALFDRIVARVDEAITAKYKLERSFTKEFFWQAMVRIRQQTATGPTTTCDSSDSDDKVQTN